MKLFKVCLTTAISLATIIPSLALGEGVQTSQAPLLKLSAQITRQNSPLLVGEPVQVVITVLNAGDSKWKYRDVGTKNFTIILKENNGKEVPRTQRGIREIGPGSVLGSAGMGSLAPATTRLWELRLDHLFDLTLSGNYSFSVQPNSAESRLDPRAAQQMASQIVSFTLQEPHESTPTIETTPPRTLFCARSLSPHNPDIATGKSHPIERYRLERDGQLWPDGDAGRFTGNVDDFVVNTKQRAAYVLDSKANLIRQYHIAADNTFVTLDPLTIAVPEYSATMALAPSSRFLYVASSFRIAQFAVGTDGRLQPLQPFLITASDSRLNLTGRVPIAIEPQGRFLYLSDRFFTERGCGLWQFRITANGQLQKLAQPLGKPSIAFQGSPRTPAFSPDGRYAYFPLNITTTGARGWIAQCRINDDGTLTPLTPASIDTPGEAHSVIVTPDGRFLYAVNSSQNRFGGTGQISQYRIGSDGTLTPVSVLASPALAGDQSYSQLAIESRGQFLYVTGKQLAQFQIASDGRLDSLFPGEAFFINRNSVDARLLVAWAGLMPHRETATQSNPSSGRMFLSRSVAPPGAPIFGEVVFPKSHSSSIRERDFQITVTRATDVFAWPEIARYDRLRDVPLTRFGQKKMKAEGGLREQKLWLSRLYDLTASGIYTFHLKSDQASASPVHLYIP